MKHPTQFVLGLPPSVVLCISYSGELWLSQASQRSGTPPNMLAHGFLAGVVHSWNNRKELRFPDFASTPPQIKCNQKPYGDRKRLYQRPNPDLKAPAKALFAVIMNRFPCRDDSCFSERMISRRRFRRLS